MDNEEVGKEWRRKIAFRCDDISKLADCRWTGAAPDRGTGKQ